MGVYRRGKVWWIDFCHEGQRIRRYGGRIKKDAVEYLEAVRTDIRRGDLGFLDKARSPAFDGFAEEYISHAKRNKRSWRRDLASLKHLRAFFKSKKLSAISSHDVEGYKAWRAEQDTARGHAPCKATVDRELCCLRRMFNLAIEWGKLRTNPVTPKAFYRESNERMHVLTDDEEARLLEVAAQHLKPIIRLTLATGMRKGEVLGLRWRQIDWQRRVILLAAEDSKNKMPDTVSLNGEMIELLHSLRREGPYVFGGESPFQDVKTAWRTALKRAGLDKSIRFHDLRHTVGSRLIQRGADLATVQAFLRHRSIKMTMRYIHSCEKAKRQAAELLSKECHKRVTPIEKAYQEAQVAVA